MIKLERDIEIEGNIIKDVRYLFKQKKKQMVI